MISLNNFIERNSSGKKVLGLFILTNAIFIFMITVTMSKTMDLADGMTVLDLMPLGYDTNYVNQLFSSLGENGRNYYLTKQIPIDLIYPLIFGFSYCLILGYFLLKLDKFNSKFSYLCLLPVITAFADYLENIGIISLLNNYPTLTQMAVQMTNVFSIVKSTSMGLYFIVLLIVVIRYGVSKVKK